MNNALHPVVLVDDPLHLGPLDRLEALIGGANFAPYLREEPISFDMHDPIYGFGCGVQGCASAQHPGGMVVHQARPGALGRSTQRSRRSELEGHSDPISCQRGQRPDGLPVAGLSFLYRARCDR